MQSASQQGQQWDSGRGYSRSHRPRVLLVNPPIHDFTAYDFWLRPYGMLRVAGRLSQSCALTCFDYLISEPRDPWGRGRFPESFLDKPGRFGDIPRRFRRFGRPREHFREFLGSRRIDFALVQTSMTYWYPGVREVIEDLRKFQPAAKIVLGGNYATLCAAHARSLGPDLVVESDRLEPLWQLLEVVPGAGLPFWQAPLRGVGVIKLTEGCPFRCSYCSVPIVHPDFAVRPTGACLAEAAAVAALGARDLAFYDDALLFRATEILLPFLDRLAERGIALRLHSPNALNARMLTPEVAGRMVQAGFASFFIGLESVSGAWQKSTGGKVLAGEFSRAVESLRSAGARAVAAYVLLGHPGDEEQAVEETMDAAHRQGVRILLAEFSPIPGTPDGERCQKWADMSEPLDHNKTAFAMRRLGIGRVHALKDLARALNARLGACDHVSGNRAARAGLK